LAPHPRKHFRFHAGGHAFSAEFTRPTAHQVDALASACLPTIGGRAHAHVDDFEAPCLVKIKRAHTCASGSFQDEVTATSHVTSTIEALNLLDVLTADRITSRLTSEHVYQKKGKTDVWEPLEGEGHIIALGSAFENLRIGGYLFKIKLRHDLLVECDTHEKLVSRIAKEAKSGKMAATRGKVTVCSLVEEIETDFPGLSPEDKKCHIVKIPHFGTVAFAELSCTEGVKTLTMLRFDLGSPVVGKGSGGETTLNGGQSPPPTKGGGG
jgi:hypothetical protein